MLVIEHQTLFAKALCELLATAPEIAIVGDAATVDAGLLRRVTPTLILLDADRPGVDVAATIALCRDHAPAAQVCVLSMRVEPIFMRRCLRAGAGGYVLKAATPDELSQAIRFIAGGAPYADPGVAGDLLRQRNRAGDQGLSDRQIEILRVVAEGLSNKEISVRLRLSEKTVKNHLSRIFAKLGISSRAQAAVYAIKHGLT